MKKLVDIAREHFNAARFNECIESCIKIITHNPKNVEIWALCALSYAGLNRLNEAIECLNEALKLDAMQGGSNKFNLSLNLAEIYRRNNMVLQAISILRAFLPKNDENLHFNLAKCYADLKDYELSIKHYTMAIQINPKDIHAIFNLANSEAALGRLNLALKYYALAYEGGLGDAGVNLAQIYVDFDLLDSALNLYGELESYYLQDSNFYFNYANALRFSGQNDAAASGYYKALSLRNDARYAINFAYLLLSAGEIESGFLLYERRKNLLQDSKNKYNSVVLNRHFLDFGFESKAALFRFLRGKKVALYHEQGFGDSIMFARFIPMLLDCVRGLDSKFESGVKSSVESGIESGVKSSGKKGEVFLFLPKELESLFSCFNLNIFTNYKFSDYDIAIPLPSLAYLFANDRNILESLQIIRPLFMQSLFIESRVENKLENPQEIKQKVTESSIPIKKILKSYEIDSKDCDDKMLRAKKQYKNQAHKLDIAMKNIDSKPKNSNINNLDSIFANEKNIKVGLNFMSNPHFQNAREKSIYPQKLLESLPKRGFKYYSLQYEGIDSELIEQFNVTDLREFIGDFSDSARILTRLDFVISIDSALAHLSASLGLPTAILLHKRHDWRWGKLDTLAQTGHFKIDSINSNKTDSVSNGVDFNEIDSINHKTDFNKINSINNKNPNQNKKNNLASSCLWYDNIYLFKQTQLHEWSNTLESLGNFLQNYKFDRI